MARLGSTLFSGGLVRPLGGAVDAGWVLVSDGRVEGLGLETDMPSAERTVDLDGGVLVPAFCDAHCHLPATGLYTLGLDFRGETRAAPILDALSSRAAAGGELLFGGNFEDPLDEPLTAAALDRAVGDNDCLVIRADMHSCVVSSSLLDRLDLAGLEGVDVDETGVPTGYLREDAASGAFGFFDRNLPKEQQRSALRAAIELAYSKGVAAVDEMFIVDWRGWDQLEMLQEITAEAALDVAIYPATGDIDRVVELGFTHIGGDYFLDGSFGSHTAWMKDPYEEPPPAGSPPNGIRYRSDEELHDFFRRSHERGIQVGVHAIGDAAIEQALTTWELVAAVSENGVGELGHRIEHFECATDDHIKRAAKLGLRISIQPAFDRLWGGTEGLYARRLGSRRALGMNRFGSMKRAGLALGAGSDSTVTPLDPFFQMAALRQHHVPEESLEPHEALALHTVGSFGLRSRGGPPRGLMSPTFPSPADFALLDRDPLTVSVEELLGTQVLGTWISGTRVWPPAQAERA
ncbi:MAG: amidohydrolase [Actinomycetota bacterium]